LCESPQLKQTLQIFGILPTSLQLLHKVDSSRRHYFSSHSQSNNRQLTQFVAHNRTSTHIWHNFEVIYTSVFVVKWTRNAFLLILQK